MRTGVDLAYKSGFRQIDIPPVIATASLLGIVFFFVFKHRNDIADFFASPRFLIFLILESLLYGLLLGLAVGGITGIFVSSGLAFSTPKVAALVINLGAGVYEELVFRLLLLSAMAFGLRRIFRGKSAPAYAVAIIASSACFSYSHHLDIFNEPVTLKLLMFRFFAGIAFGLIFSLRGYGVVAYTHTFYNILLMFR